MYRVCTLLTAAAVALLPIPALAATIDLGRGSVTCQTADMSEPASCLGFIGKAPSTSGTQADLFKLKNSSEKKEASFLNTLLGEDGRFGQDDVFKQDTGGKDTASFLVNTPFFAVKLGPDHAYIVNDSGGAIFVTYEKYSGKAGNKGGISHVSQFGGFSDGGGEPPNAVPLPPALAMLLAGLGGLGLVARRRLRGKSQG